MERNPPSKVDSRSTGHEILNIYITRGSLQCPQQLATAPYSEPDGPSV
jgi:hypothetical protein